MLSKPPLPSAVRWKTFIATIAKHETTHNHSTLCAFLASEIAEFAHENITISIIRCDGASYQTKALHCQDQDSLQSQKFICAMPL
jgi:hypothetical protein